MAKLSIVAGAIDQSCTIFIQDSSSTVGAGLSGLAYNTASLAAYFTFAGANATATVITLATLAGVTSAHSDGGFIELDATHMKGLYRFDFLDTMLATSKGRSVTAYFYGAANMAPCVFDVELTAWDNQDGVRGALTALPNAAANAAGGLPISTAGALDMDDIGADVDAIQTSTAGLTYTVSNQVDVNVKSFAGTASAGTAGYVAPDWAHVGAPTTTVDLSGTTIKNVDNAIATVTTVTNQLTAAAIATGVWEDTTAGGDFGTAGSIGKLIATTGINVATIGGQTASAAGTVTFPGTIASATNITAGTITTVTNLTNAPSAGDFTATMKTSIGTAVAASAVASVTGNVGGSVGSVVGNTDQTGDVYGLLTGATTEVTSVPTSVDTLVNMIKWLFLLSRNKITQTATTTLVRNNADGATVGTSTVSDDGTTAIRGKFS